MSKYVTLAPAYGRDYTARAAVLADLAANKDFIIMDFFNPYCNKPVTVAQLLEAGYTHFKARYSKLTRVTIFDRKAVEEARQKVNS